MNRDYFSQIQEIAEKLSESPDLEDQKMAAILFTSLGFASLEKLDIPLLEMSRLSRAEIARNNN